MLARVCELRNSLVLRSAPAIEREFNVFRTALVLTALRDALGLVLCVAVDRISELPGVDLTTLPREVGPTAERDIAGLALT
jgi:hypothetical protein